ncbi:MAG: ABC transporter substrate-binding protein [Candidatus Lustribacter sp.]|jgi:branched-chain amino acid transport system substrate-binding protein
MTHLRKIFVAVLVGLFALTAAGAADLPPLKIGIVYSYTGGDPSAGPVLDAALAAWLAQHNGMMSGRKVELIKRDDTGVAPDVVRRLATELVVQDHVDFLLGSTFTPNAVAMATVSTQSKTPYCMVNAAGGGLLAKAPYSTRLGVTMAQITVPLAKWAWQNGVKTAYSVLANYQPGIDGGKAFSDTFTAAGGKMLGEVLVPVNNTEFSAYIQRVKDAKPDAVFVFVGAGIPSVAFFKAFHQNGLDKLGIRILASGDTLEEDALPQMGDEPNGVISTLNYSAVHNSKLNRDFVNAFHAADPTKTLEPNFFAVAGYDCMSAIDKAVAAQKGSVDPDKTMAIWSGLKLDSPRGPIVIDPQTHDITQDMYMRKTTKEGTKYEDVEFSTTPAVKADGT